MKLLITQFNLVHQQIQKKGWSGSNITSQDVTTNNTEQVPVFHVGLKFNLIATVPVQNKGVGYLHIYST